MSVLRFRIGDAPPGRLDKALARDAPEEAALSRSRLARLIAEGAVTVDGAVARPTASARSRQRPRSSIALAPAAEIADGARGDPARRRLRGRRADRRRQAGGDGGPSGPGLASGHAGQRADPPLRRQPVGDRRRAAAGHRAPDRQGHVRPAGRGQDRPGASRPRRAVRGARRSSAPMSRSATACRIRATPRLRGIRGVRFEPGGVLRDRRACSAGTGPTGSARRSASRPGATR